MQAKLCTKPKLLSEFLEICTKNKYFAATIDKNILKDVKFLDHSSNVQANIERQWLFKSKDIENSLKTFSNTDFMEYGENLTLLEKHAIIRKRDRLSRSIPFGLIDIENDGKATQFGGGSIDNGGNSSDASIGIWLNNGAKHLTCWYLVNDKQSQEYFYRIQRLRKIWWMKVEIELTRKIFRSSIFSTRNRINSSFSLFCHFFPHSMQPIRVVL